MNIVLGLLPTAKGTGSKYKEGSQEMLSYLCRQQPPWDLTFTLIASPLGDGKSSLSMNSQNPVPAKHTKHPLFQARYSSVFLSSVPWNGNSFDWGLIQGTSALCWVAGGKPQKTSQLPRPHQLPLAVYPKCHVFQLLELASGQFGWRERHPVTGKDKVKPYWPHIKAPRG